MLDVLIIGAGAAGMSCALVLGSANDRPYVKTKKIAIVTHQKTSHLQTALFNNVLGLKPKTLGTAILNDGKAQLKELYPHVLQVENEKVIAIEDNEQKEIATEVLTPLSQKFKSYELFTGIGDSTKVFSQITLRSFHL